MSGNTVNLKKRRFLVAATTAMGGAGIVLAATPFVLSMTPSARAKAEGGPVEVDIGKLQEGQLLTVEWRRKPVWILRRPPAMLANLEGLSEILVDPRSTVLSQQPSYARNLYRSIRPEVLVLLAVCTHLGCVPAQHFEPGTASGLGGDWPGGFFCHCHGSKFDLAGRVFKRVPAPTNLVVPPHRFASDTRIVLGDDSRDEEGRPRREQAVEDSVGVNA